MGEPPHMGKRFSGGFLFPPGFAAAKSLPSAKASARFPNANWRMLSWPRKSTASKKPWSRRASKMLEVQRKVTESMGAEEGGIFDAHLLVLEDRVLIDEVMRIIQDKKVNAEYAFQAVAENYADALAKIEDEYLRERATRHARCDVAGPRQSAGRQDGADLQQLNEPCIIIAHDLTPVRRPRNWTGRMVLGFATDIGSKTSHTAIMARSLQHPGGGRA